MNTKSNWRDIVARPFVGWAFVANIGIAWVLLQIVKSITSSGGYVIGGLLSTFLLFFLAWLVGVPYVLANPSKEVPVSHIKPETAVQILKKSKGLKYFAVFTLCLFSLMVVLVAFFAK